MLDATAPSLEIVTITPEMAGQLLDHNGMNRPLRQPHVNRIAAQITGGKWKFNGDAIKISDTGDVLDGQHRLWAILEAKEPVQTVIVRGIKRDAFSTMDAIRQVRSGGDTIARLGQARYRNQTSTALTWLLRWQRGTIETFRDPKNRIENSDIEEAFVAHPSMLRAIEHVAPLLTMANIGTLAFLYYTMMNRNEAIAERFIETLKNPAGVGVDDPFYRLRVWLTEQRTVKRKEPTMVIALAIKAANAAAKGKSIKMLNWRSQGVRVEAFPKIEF